MSLLYGRAEASIAVVVLAALSTSAAADTSTTDVVESAPEAEWYRPVAADDALRPRATAAFVPPKKKPPFVVGGQIVFGSYTSMDSESDSFGAEPPTYGESSLRIRIEQVSSAAFLGVVSFGDVRYFELGAEFSTGGYPLHEDAKSKLSLMTPVASVRVLGLASEESAPTMLAVGISALGLRYCRCVSSARPLVVDLRPSFNFGGGSTDVSDPISGSTMTSEISFQGLAINLGVSVGL